MVRVFNPTTSQLRSENDNTAQKVANTSNPNVVTARSGTPRLLIMEWRWYHYTKGSKLRCRITRTTFVPIFKRAQHSHRPDITGCTQANHTGHRMHSVMQSSRVDKRVRSGSAEELSSLHIRRMLRMLFQSLSCRVICFIRITWRPQIIVVYCETRHNDHLTLAKNKLMLLNLTSIFSEGWVPAQPVVWNETLINYT